MSQPNFSTTDSLTREEAINQLVSSIAAEELGLSNIINTEGEKLQFILGTISGLTSGPATIEDTININTSIMNLLSSMMQLQYLLTNKLCSALSAPITPGTTGPTGPTGENGTFEGATGPIGPTGVTGPAGGAGIDGIAGATGIFSPVSTTSTAGFGDYLYNLFFLLSVGGARTLALPQAQIHSSDILIDSSNTVFTVNTPGTYYIAYEINTTVALLAGSQLLINNTAYPASIIKPAINTSQHHAEIIINLAIGNTISLQMTNTTALPISVTLNTGAGAAMTIIRIN